MGKSADDGSIPVRSLAVVPSTDEEKNEVKKNLKGFGLASSGKDDLSLSDPQGQLRNRRYPV
jgi:hypothetical protein